jgi:hypothetical protein
MGSNRGQKCLVSLKEKKKKHFSTKKLFTLRADGFLSVFFSKLLQTCAAIY